MMSSIPEEKRKLRENSSRLVEEWLAKGNEVTQYDYAIQSDAMRDGVSQCGLCKKWKPVAAFSMVSHPGSSRCTQCVAMHRPIRAVSD
jgi:hypothetical protein